jgi:LysM repeat protein
MSPLIKVHSLARLLDIATNCFQSFSVRVNRQSHPFNQERLQTPFDAGWFFQIVITSWTSVVARRPILRQNLPSNRSGTPANMSRNVPRLMTLYPPNRGVYFRRPGIVLFCLLAPFFLHTNVVAQDVAEAARQQQAHKSQQPVAPHHVYTEDDLKRPRILTPEDQDRVEARRKDSPAPAAPNTTSLDAEMNPPSESLGEIARRYREERAAREGEAALHKNRPSAFSLELPGEAFAEPKSSAGSLRVPRTAVVPSFLVAPSPVPIGRSTVPARVSPFQPRPGVAPTVIPSTPAIPSALATRLNSVRIQVQRGDSWWKLARRYLGSGSHWQELVSLNPGAAAHPDFLPSGSIVELPDNGASPTARAPAPETITIQRGDTLWSLARVHLGRGSEWPRFAHANPQLSDYLHLRVGAHLQMP